MWQIIFFFFMSYHTEAEECCQSYELPALRALMGLNGPVQPHLAQATLCPWTQEAQRCSAPGGAGSLLPALPAGPVGPSLRLLCSPPGQGPSADTPCAWFTTLFGTVSGPCW